MTDKISKSVRPLDADVAQLKRDHDALEKLKEQVDKLELEKNFPGEWKFKAKTDENMFIGL